MSTPTIADIPAIIPIDDLDDLLEKYTPQDIVGRLCEYSYKVYCPIVFDAKGNLCLALTDSCNYLVDLDYVGDRVYCNEEPVVVFLHRGAPGWCYAYDYQGKFLADYRNQQWICEKHRGKPPLEL